MNLKKSRRALSVLLSVVLSVFTVIFSFAITAEFTFANDNFIINHLATDKAADECNKQLDIKFKALEKECSIPARIFQSVEKNGATKQALKTASENLFSSESPTLYNESRIEYFYNLCVAYLEANEIQYNKDDVMNTANQAAQIYSDCVGIHCESRISIYLPKLQTNCTKLVSASLLVIFCCLFFIMIMYKEKRDAMTYFASALAGGAGGGILSALMCALFKVWSHYSFYPEIYTESFSSMAKNYFLLSAAVSLVIMIFSAVILFTVKKQRDKKGI